MWIATSKGRLETLVKFKREKEKSQKSNLIRGWLTEKEMIKLGWDESPGLHWEHRFLIIYIYIYETGLYMIQFALCKFSGLCSNNLSPVSSS